MVLDIVILAAGQGTRMRSALSKVLHPVAGKPMLGHAIDCARTLSPRRIHVVIGHGAEQVRSRLDAPDIHWVMQEQQLGTGHAVAQALPGVEDADQILVLYGDVPLLREATLKRLSEQAGAAALGLLTVEMQDPTGYGRIVRDAAGRVLAIVEQKDATPAQLAISEGNTGIMALPGAHASRWLNSLSNANAQGEYYLTDVVAKAVEEELNVVVAQPEDELEVMGANNRQQLSVLERAWQQREALRLMTAGVTLADPARLDVRGEVEVGRDIFIDVNVILEGRVQLGDGVTIEANCVIRDSSIAAGAHIKAFSHVEGAEVAADCDVGPYARLRPGTRLREGAKIGNFVEIKKADIGPGAKVNHLSYIGDAQVGAQANVGAGTITCNYDGVNKSLTQIGENAFIGSNTALVAPVRVGAGASTGAGTTVTQDVPDGALAVGRARQRNIEGWKRAVKRSS